MLLTRREILSCLCGIIGASGTGRERAWGKESHSTRRESRWYRLYVNIQRCHTEDAVPWSTSQNALALAVASRLPGAFVSCRSPDGLTGAISVYLPSGELLRGSLDGFWAKLLHALNVRTPHLEGGQGEIWLEHTPEPWMTQHKGEPGIKDFPALKPDH